ncbi:DUF2865 domain-containing protein [Rhizobium sp. AN80A]|uniref:DUF2865 domain-containing protein n=1 Tax=Rhizobium sp. AN80A TaxID=3040673 RepID=UPI0024B3B8A1|nr:DUF2865 domain-containing protein [Rhizobium sp. AN80A]
MIRLNMAAAFLIALSAPAYAQMAPICGQLRARLATVPETIGGNSPEVRRFASAIAEQNIELRKLRSDLRRNGCSSGSMVIIGGDNAGYCGELDQAEAKMLDNIANLQMRRDQLRAQSPDARLRNELFAALDENNCNAPMQQYDEPQYASPPSIDDQAMRDDTFIPLGGERQRSYTFSPSGQPLSNLNTVCVRTCDGGFFPLRSNATSFDFARDASTCQQMCPGIQTELFYRDVSSGETDSMISASSGAPYSAMPYAFAYKNRKPGETSSCSCNLPAYYEQMRRNQQVGEPPPQQSSITSIETPKPAIAKPESNATPQQPAPPPQPQVPDRPYDPTAGKVRQVGPQFLAGDRGTIDLKNPAMPGAQQQQPPAPAPKR